MTLAGFLLGTVSGSGVATTVTLGSVAWPILRRVGYSAETAGAMLAAAGIGALLSPPTLGAAAFLIAEYLRISYLDVLIMATIPTVLYYLSILVTIDRSSTRGVLRGADGPEELTSSEGPEGTRRSGFQYLHFVSLVFVAVLMALGFTPFRAVFWATVVAVAMSWFGPKHERLGPRRTVDALAAGGRDILPILATTAVAGIIVGVTTLTGLGLKAAGLIVGLAGGSLPLTVFFGALAVLLLGLAVPVTASYIIAAVMVAPALTSVGVPLVAAHMFIFYYAVLSEVSPPTALAPFAAAAITGGRPFKTMMLTWKFALPAFLVPFAFTLAPRGLALLMESTWPAILEVLLFSSAGVVLLALTFSRRHGRPFGVDQVVCGVAGLLLLYPARLANLAGLAGGGLALLLLVRGGGGRR